MALYENEQKLKGFVGKDVESYATKNQTTFVVFSLATKSGYKKGRPVGGQDRMAPHRRLR